MAKKLVKQWCDILAPKYFGNKVLGQTLAVEPAKTVGKVIEASLVELTGEASKYYMIVSFKIKNAEGSKLITDFAGHTCTKDFVARVVQIGTERIDTNNVVTLKDGKVRVKTIAVTNGPVRHGVEKKLRSTIQDMIVKELSEMTVESFVKNMITGVIQKKIRKDINKIYPLRQFEFTASKIL